MGGLQLAQELLSNTKACDVDPLEFLRTIQNEKLPLTVVGRPEVTYVEMLRAVDFVKAVIISAETTNAEARVLGITWLGRSALERKR